MSRLRTLGLALGIVAVSTFPARGAGYHIVEEIRIPGEGGWDYVIGDPAAHRLYVSHSTAIVVADTSTGKVVGEIPDTPGVHGIALAPDLGRGFTSNGRGNTSFIVDLKTLERLGVVATGTNPDSIRYLQDRKEVWTFNHTGGTITVFDPMSGFVRTTIEIGGELEEAVEDPDAHRVYVNVEDRAAIAVIDTVTHDRRAMWPLAGCEGPTALAFDSRHHLLLSSCQGRTLVVDSPSGRVLTSFVTPDRVDGNGFDPATGLAFVSSGTGVLTIAHEDAPDRFTVVQTVKTQPSGRTMWLDPESHRVYVPVGSVERDAQGRPHVARDSMKVLVLSE